MFCYQLITHSFSDLVTLAWWSGSYIWQSHRRRIKEMEKYVRAKSYGKAWHMFTCPRVGLWIPLLQQQVESFSLVSPFKYMLWCRRVPLFRMWEWGSLQKQKNKKKTHFTQTINSVTHGDAVENFWDQTVGKGHWWKSKNRVKNVPIKQKVSVEPLRQHLRSLLASKSPESFSLYHFQSYLQKLTL